MGAHSEFGCLPVHIRRVVYYALSPYEQNAWKHSVSRGLPNLLRRCLRALPSMAPGFIGGYGVYQWGNWAHERSLRKDPKDYENDE